MRATRGKPQDDAFERNIYSRLAGKLGREIVAGVHPPGSLLPSAADMCARFSVSRTALREAYSILSAKGLIVARPKIGTRVRPKADWNVLDPEMLAWHLEAEPSEHFVRELFALRQMVEPEAAALAAAAPSRPTVDRIADAYGRMERFKHGEGDLIGAEARRAEGAANPDSMDHYFLGLGLYHRSGLNFCTRPARISTARWSLVQTTSDALVRRAWVEVTLAAAWFPDDRAERLDSAEADLRKALRLRPGSAEAHSALGVLYINSNRVALGLVECERALAIDRNLATAHGWIGMGKFYIGRDEETEGHIQEALRISPRDAYACAWMVFAAFAKLGQDEDEEAAVWANRAIQANPGFMSSFFLLAAALVRLGRMTEAREAVRAGLALNPAFSIARYRASPSSDNPRYLAALSRILEALRQAGAPEE